MLLETLHDNVFSFLYLIFDHRNGKNIDNLKYLWKSVIFLERDERSSLPLVTQWRRLYLQRVHHSKTGVCVGHVYSVYICIVNTTTLDIDVWRYSITLASHWIPSIIIDYSQTKNIYHSKQGFVIKISGRYCSPLSPSWTIIIFFNNNTKNFIYLLPEFSISENDCILKPGFWFHG